MRLDGAIVSPTSCASMGGNSTAGADDESCNVFLVASMEFSGNAALGANGCHFYGTKTPVARIARLVQ